MSAYGNLHISVQTWLTTLGLTCDQAHDLLTQGLSCRCYDACCGTWRGGLADGGRAYEDFGAGQSTEPTCPACIACLDSLHAAMD